MRCATVLALGLFVASAAALNCGTGVPGGWSDIGDDSMAYVTNATDVIVAEYASLANATSFLACPSEPVTSVAGCMQVVAGTNYRLQVNVTCPDVNGREVLVVLSADLFEGLPGNNMDDDKIDDVEVEAVFVDGAYIGDNLDDIVDDSTDVDDRREDALDDVEDQLEDRFDEMDDQFDDQFDDDRFDDDQFDDDRDDNDADDNDDDGNDSD